MIIVRNSDGSYSASGDGYDHPIVAEGFTPSKARDAYLSQYADQYAKAQTETHISDLMYGELS